MQELDPLEARQVPYVETSIFVNVEPMRAYEYARDMERFPDYMPDVESVKVLERKNNGTVTEWVTNVEGTPIIWIEEDIFDDDHKTISYRLIEGDLDKFEGLWSFNARDEGTEIILGVDFDFGIPHLEELIGSTLKTKVQDNSDMMLKGMKKFLEGE
jgi:ribosome-associated toxin RatA of RatAB toxin-antitoxin module